jgi:hypothetical protein
MFTVQGTRCTRRAMYVVRWSRPGSRGEGSSPQYGIIFNFFWVPVRYRGLVTMILAGSIQAAVHRCLLENGTTPLQLLSCYRANFKSWVGIFTHTIPVRYLKIKYFSSNVIGWDYLLPRRGGGIFQQIRAMNLRQICTIQYYLTLRLINTARWIQPQDGRTRKRCATIEKKKYIILFLWMCISKNRYLTLLLQKFV